VNAHICYSGVEQAMKMLLPQYPKTNNPHNLWDLYEKLLDASKGKKNPREATNAIKRIKSYYQVYHSFHRFSDRPKEKTAEEFLKNIGDKYTP